MEKSTSILERVQTPADIKNCSMNELKQLAQEIRELMVDVTSRNGGHLASSLGVVELTIALHFVFDTPNDKLLWDVGHQSYAHKILTGRKDAFQTLRQTQGISGFPLPEESPYDAFVAGHAGVSISAALGMAVARDRRGTHEKVIAVLGDASITNGVTQEAMNNISNVTDDFIIVLNDNRMAISPNVGAMTRYLNTLISAAWYNAFKRFVKRMITPIDRKGRMRRFIARAEEALKRLIVRSVVFEEFGVRYIGPIDGHDIRELINTFKRVKKEKTPVILHVITEKGKGYAPAAVHPEKFHGIGVFDKATGNTRPSSHGFSYAFGESICELAEKHPDVCALTAAMCSGTGLSLFRDSFPDRFYDVGIAESHGIVFAAGLAASKLRPVVAIYATFLQRALDNIFHDVCLQNLPVILCCDRSGVVEDGPTHHGIHDLGFLLGVPNLSVLQPRNENELRAMLFAAYDHATPVAIRYPRGGTSTPFDATLPLADIPWGKAEVIREGTDVALFASGAECDCALAVADILEKNTISAAVVNVRFIAPLDADCLCRFAMQMPIVTLEDHCVETGLASVVSRVLASDKNLSALLYTAGWHRDGIIHHGKQNEVRELHHFTSTFIAEKIRTLLRPN